MLFDRWLRNGKWIFGSMVKAKINCFRALKLHFVLKAPPVSICSMNYHNQNFIGILEICLNIIQAGKDHRFETLYFIVR